MEDIINYISQPWSWYVSGLLISLIMFLLLWAGERFGVSTTLKTMCTIGGAGSKFAYFDINWKEHIWGLVFVFGAILGGFIATNYLSSAESIQISAATIQDLSAIGIDFDGEIAPMEIFSWENLTTVKGFLIMVVGGFLVGFGTRWANGCTSGHAISGLSSLQLPSLIAVVGFFIGGLVMTHLLFPLIF